MIRYFYTFFLLKQTGVFFLVFFSSLVVPSCERKISGNGCASNKRESRRGKKGKPHHGPEKDNLIRQAIKIWKEADDRTV